MWLKINKRRQLFFNPCLSFSLDSLFWSKSSHYHFNWLCAAHLEYRSLVFRMVRILAFEYVKTRVDKENKFRKIKSMQHVLGALE